MNKLQKSSISEEEDFSETELKSAHTTTEDFDKVAKRNNVSKNKKNRVRVKPSKILKDGELDFERLGFADASQADNLQKIIGIGPYTEEKLNDIGIFTFDQISKLNAKDIELVTEKIQFFPERINNDHWVSKAKMLAQSKKKLRDGPIKMKRA